MNPGSLYIFFKFILTPAYDPGEESAGFDWVFMHALLENSPCFMHFLHKHLLSWGYWTPARLVNPKTRSPNPKTCSVVVRNLDNLLRSLHNRLLPQEGKTSNRFQFPTHSKPSHHPSHSHSQSFPYPSNTTLKPPLNLPRPPVDAAAALA